MRLKIYDQGSSDIILRQLRSGMSTPLRFLRGFDVLPSQGRILTHSTGNASQILRNVYIDHINRLTDQWMPPTSHIVKNLAEEIRGGPVGKNWVGRFIARHKKELKSLYLRNIDNLRVAAEYAPMFILFFTIVCDFIAFSSVFALENLANIWCPHLVSPSDREIPYHS